MSVQSPMVPPPSTGRCQPLDIETEIHSMLTPPEMRQMRSVSSYTITKKVGEGTYGAVFLAKEKTTGERVALKKIKLDHNAEREGFPITSLREIRHLFKVGHANVVELKEMVYGGRSLNDQCDLYMVLEYLEHDLLGIQQTLKNQRSGNVCFSIGDVKCYVHQLLQGLHACHKADVLHRDLKSANLLVSKEGLLKIADFGLSRKLSRDERLTPKVCTLWYRPPELLMAGHDRLPYGAEVDIWSAGCIFAELLAGRPIFDKNEEVEALYAICQICGSPNPETWPEVVMLPGWAACRKEFKQNRLRKTLMTNINRARPKQTDEDKESIKEAVDLICRMLTLNPAQRPSAIDIYKDNYFYFSKPDATEKSKLAGVSLPDSHALDWERPKRANNKQSAQERGKGGKQPRQAGGPSEGPLEDANYASRRPDAHKPWHDDAGSKRYEPYSRGRGGPNAHSRPGARDYQGPSDRFPRDDHDYGGRSRHADSDFREPSSDWARSSTMHQADDAGYSGFSRGGGGGPGGGYHGGSRYVGDRYLDYDHASWSKPGMGAYLDYDYDGPALRGGPGHHGAPSGRMHYDYDDVGSAGESWTGTSRQAPSKPPANASKSGWQKPR